MARIYLSPSTQEYNEYVNNLGTEEQNMNRLADAFVPYLDQLGIAYNRNTPEMTAGSSIKVDTLETTWQTIMSGIEETKEIQADAKRQRADARARLENIKEQFYSNFTMPEQGGALPQGGRNLFSK